MIKNQITKIKKAMVEIMALTGHISEVFELQAIAYLRVSGYKNGSMIDLSGKRYRSEINGLISEI